MEKSKDFWWVNEESESILNRGYLLKGETIEDAVERICNAAASHYKGDLRKELKARFKDAIKKGYISMSSPIWSNMGTSRGLPISCFNVHIPDNVEGITHKMGEVIMQTKIGGGTSGYFGELRPRGSAVTDNGESSGAVSFMKLFDTAMEVVSQGGVRRGSFAAYLDIDHPDVQEFLNIKDIGNPIQNLFYAVCVPDYWLKEMIDGDVEKRNIWAKVLESRQFKGLPYIFFTDNVNKNKPEIYKELNLPINASNLCSEIALPSNSDESFVCCLSSLNLALYDEWKDTNLVETAVYFLDAVMSEFIKKTSDNFYLKPAHNFAKRHRALGLGVLGLHTYYQKNNIAFDDALNVARNKVIFKKIKEEAYAASEKLGDELGYAPIFDETDNTDIRKRRNTTLLAIAPTTSSSAILGQVSPGIEPYSSNFYKAGLAKGNYIRKNPQLVKVLEKYDKNNDDVWRDIMLNQGSVQSLDFLTEDEKAVFKTFTEINQGEIINQAAARQEYIDQAQSLNLKIPSSAAIKDVNKLILNAWELGVKTLYYQRSTSVSKDMLTNIVNCSSCES